MNYDISQKITIRKWIVDLALTVDARDPHFIKEKIAILWVAIAKRIWGLNVDKTLSKQSNSSVDAGFNSNKFDTSDDSSVNGNSMSTLKDSSEDELDEGWKDMDETLVKMWNDGPATRELTLSIFRTLFEDLYILEDPIADKRATSLAAQCIEVVTSESILSLMYEQVVSPLRQLKYGSEGWLARWSQLLQDCLNSGVQDPNVANLLIKVLNTLKTCLYWVFPLAIRETNLLQRLSIALSCDNIEVRIVSVECLHALLTRNYTNEEDFQAIIGSVFLPEGLNSLRNVYESIQLDINHFNERAYILSKKMVEMIVGLGDFLNLPKSRLPKEVSLKQYLLLVLETTSHPSLVISGMSVQFWCSVLRVDKLNQQSDVQDLLPQLLQLASERCIKFEDVGDDHISRKFLDFDFDSTSDSQVFLGNYRKFIEDIVRLIVCIMPVPSMTWLESRMDLFFSSDIGQQSIQSTKLEYSGNPAYFLAYSQFVLVECAIRGVTRWKIWYNGDGKFEIQKNLSTIIERWCSRLIAMKINDPLLLRKYVQTLVQFAPSLRDLTQLMFSVLEKVLIACTFEYPPNASDEDRETIRDLRTSCGTELNRLAYMMPEVLINIYDDLERVIGDIISSNKLSDHESVAFMSFLLVVSQRSSISNKPERFSKIVDPVLASWTDEETMKGLMDLPWFMERVGIVKIAEYFRSRGVTSTTDLFATSMDEEGKNLKTELKSKWSALFPIRATRIFIQYTIEKLNHNEEPYQDLLALWKPRIQPILPHILQLIAQIQAYHNPKNWVSLPEEVQTFVKYSCMERFWQMGVSTQTKDEFVDENVRAMHTLRDFADSVGHIIRYTREYAFLTLGSISQLEETIYEIPGMAGKLYQALAGDSAGITSHSWRHMTSLVLRNIVKNCPVHLMDPFLKEFLPPMLTKLDQVLVEKWEKIMSDGIMMYNEEDTEDLSEEIMEEHLLRQLTAVVDRFLIDMVGQLGGKIPSDSSSNNNQAELRKVVLGSKDILAPFLSICSHIMTFKDNRCSFNTCLIMRSILPDILRVDDEVDDYICDNLMKTCIDILNDKYFADVHHEAGYVLTTIYTILRAKYDRPFTTLCDLLPTAPRKSVTEFEERLVEAKSLRQQRGEFLEFLSFARQSHYNDESYDSAQRDIQQKKAEKKLEKQKLLRRKKTTDIMETEELETSMVNLFNEGDY